MRFPYRLCELCLCGYASIWALSAAVWAQDLTPAATPSFSVEEERNRILQNLKKQIEPNLLDRDLKRIRNEVRRLGSFRAEWVKEAEDFLAANPNLSETFLYDYARIRNPRLNAAILRVFLRFENFQYPTGLVVFAGDFLADPAAASDMGVLLARLAGKHAELGPILANEIYESQTLRLNAAQNLEIMHQSCKAGARFDSTWRAKLDQAVESSSDFWARIAGEDLRACLKDL